MPSITGCIHDWRALLTIQASDIELSSQSSVCIQTLKLSSLEEREHLLCVIASVQNFQDKWRMTGCKGEFYSVLSDNQIYRDGWHIEKSITVLVIGEDHTMYSHFWSGTCMMHTVKSRIVICHRTNTFDYMVDMTGLCILKRNIDSRIIWDRILGISKIFFNFPPELDLKPTLIACPI